MDGESSDKENDLSSSEVKEDKIEEPSKESTFFLIKKETEAVKNEKNAKEGKANKEIDVSAAFFIPGADTRVKGRLKD